MEKTLWALEIEGVVEKIYADINKAKEFAYYKLLAYGYDPENDEYKVFKELEESFNDEEHSGFWVDELLYCYEVDYVK